MEDDGAKPARPARSRRRPASRSGPVIPPSDDTESAPETGLADPDDLASLVASPDNAPPDRDAADGDAADRDSVDLASIAEAEARAEADAFADSSPSDRVEFAVAGVADPHIGLPILDDARSPNPATCPFFRNESDDGRLGIPVEYPSESNRCAAFGEPKPQSLRQQELVCLTAGHVSCPRYLRGSLFTHETVTVDPPRRGLTRPILAAAVVLAVSAAASFAFVLVRGGLSLPGTPAPSDVAVATPAPTEPPPTAVPTQQPTPVPTPPPTASPTPPPTTSPRPTPTATPRPTASPARTPTPTPRPSSDRYDLLEPCPDKPDCWIYTIRSGDNVYSIANYFGVPEATVRELNPWLATTPLRAGQELILPPPTR